MKDLQNGLKASVNRRSFMKRGLTAAGAATVSAGLLGNGLSAASEGPEEKSGRLTPGDAAILRFLAAAEILETDLWQQYNELGGNPRQRSSGREWKSNLHCRPCSSRRGHGPVHP